MLLVCITLQIPCYAQKKKKANQDVVEQPVKKQEKQRDTIPVIYEKVPVKRISQKEEILAPPPATKQRSDTGKLAIPPIKKNLPIVYDTVRNKPKKRQGEETIIDDHKTIVIEMNKPANAKLPIIKDTITEPENSNCKCMSMDLKAQDSVDFENYINYRFIFKNKCKEQILVHSGSFRFLVNDYFGHPVTRLRKVDFVKRFDYPEYVRISPGETYEFNFADDPFFEFKMNRSQQYRFNFMYNNTVPAVDKKGRHAPKSFQCLEVREKVVYVK